MWLEVLKTIIIYIILQLLIIFNEAMIVLNENIEELINIIGR